MYRIGRQSRRQVKAESRVWSRPKDDTSRNGARLTNEHNPRAAKFRREREGSPPDLKEYRLTPRPTPRDNVTPDAFTSRTIASGCRAISARTSCSVEVDRNEAKTREIDGGVDWKLEQLDVWNGWL